jgi:hypothetical protein
MVTVLVLIHLATAANEDKIQEIQLLKDFCVVMVTVSINIVVVSVIKSRNSRDVLEWQQPTNRDLDEQVSQWKDSKSADMYMPLMENGEGL